MSSASTTVTTRPGPDADAGPTLIGDPRVALIPVRDNHERLVALDWMSGPAAGAARLVRAGLADRLAAAQQALPDGITLHLSEGFRRASQQQAIISSYRALLRRDRPTAPDAELDRLTSRYVAPLAVAPHVAGAAVDLTLADADGNPLPLGCALDATPEESDGACYFAAPGISAEARRNRELLQRALGGAGLVNYPTEWWHWSFGDRYWAYRTGADQACYGPIRTGADA
ncbi:M15 family metallopeptidase [Streptacidiphilus sp. N1-12]|uniref:M15 family metallopeptidase n=2 Tax=Streptacidiphilus alkalitolerans TaxID=3342712 RepID=A0ABV6W961_9ACTN